MKINRLAVIALRIVLVGAFLLLLLFQVMSLPGQFAHMAAENQERAYLQWPLTIFGILEVACVQVVIVSTWKLLTMVKQDQIFSRRAFVWVDAIMWAIAAAWTMLAVFSAIVVLNADDPGVPLLLILMLAAGAAVGLVVVVLRALLRQAADLRSDMEAVI
jgi:NADH:ubiquinone oxidoreductase subunit 6 (subunit J)